MNKSLRAVLRFLWHHHYIGGKHFPEDKLITSRTKYLNKKEHKSFEEEYAKIKPYLLRLKKMTGSGSDWHISINPEYLADIDKLLNSGDEK